jgi:Flp pilus assembly protein TadG
MRAHRLLSAPERGSATVESVFAIVILMLMTLGAVQVAFVLYARNIVASAAHEGVRAAVERGATGSDAGAVAGAVVERSAGGLVSDLRVDTAAVERSGSEQLTVRVRGTIPALGPVPVSFPVTATATSVRESLR